MYYPIDENIAKQAQQANSFREYVAGSETAEYRKAVDEAAKIAEAQKRRVSKFYHEKIDGLLDRYSRRLAEWYNAYNRNRASCPSIMIAGGSNFPVQKKQRQNDREHTLFDQYNEINSIVEKIRSVGTGPVDLADPHAREILQEKLEKALKYQDDAKKINAYYRKNKTLIGCPVLTESEAQRLQDSFNRANAAYCLHDVPFPAYELASIRGKIKRIQERIQQLDKLQEVSQDDTGIEFDGGRIVQNAELNRLQILFDGNPDEETRSSLKSHGFRWSPKNGAWQRQLTDNAIQAAKEALEL